MNLPAQIPFISVEEYLDGEQRSETRYEYIGGQVYAMAGAGEKHNRIAGNFFFHLRAAARGKPCGVFISDMKVRVKSRDAFYYPDVMVACNPQDTASLYKEAPCLIVEVLSPATETTDRREKLLAYRTLESLRYYLLVAQDARRIEVYQRNGNGQWLYQVVEETGSIAVDCGEIAVSLSLDEVYEDVVMTIGESSNSTGEVHGA